MWAVLGAFKWRSPPLHGTDARARSSASSPYYPGEFCEPVILCNKCHRLPVQNQAEKADAEGEMHTQRAKLRAYFECNKQFSYCIRNINNIFYCFNSRVVILRRQFVYISAVRCWIWSDVVLWALNCIITIEKYFTLGEKRKWFFTQWLLHFRILSNRFLKYKIAFISEILKLLTIGLIVAKHNLRMVAICDAHHVLPF